MTSSYIGARARVCVKETLYLREFRQHPVTPMDKVPSSTIKGSHTTTVPVKTVVPCSSGYHIFPNLRASISSLPSTTSSIRSCKSCAFDKPLPQGSGLSMPNGVSLKVLPATQLNLTPTSSNRFVSLSMEGLRLP